MFFNRTETVAQFAERTFHARFPEASDPVHRTAFIDGFICGYALTLHDVAMSKFAYLSDDRTSLSDMFYRGHSEGCATSLRDKQKHQN